MTVEYVEFFVEELSMEAALRALVPKIRAGLHFDVHPFQGKDDLLAKLPRRLKGYTNMPSGWRIVVVLDEDRAPCAPLKRRVEQIARSAHLRPKPRGASRHDFDVLTRIAVEELEAWLLGDVPALLATYPRLPASLGATRSLRHPDAVRGGTWEALQRVLQTAGYFAGGLPKIQVARDVAANMDPARNTSPSFRHFRDGLRAL
ncbi:MAG: DUF4276 family protein [Polyangiales bacterium]